jgi:hypothetical protein
MVTPSRDGRRAAALAGVLVALFAGATAGGVLLVHAPLYAPVLPFVMTAAVVSTAAIVLRERDAADDREVAASSSPRPVVGNS